MPEPTATGSAWDRRVRARSAPSQIGSSGRFRVTKQTTPDAAPGHLPVPPRAVHARQVALAAPVRGPSSSPDPQNLADNGVATWGPLLDNTNYRLAETVPSGWTLTGRSCTGGEQNGNAGSERTGHSPDERQRQRSSSGDCTFTDTRHQITVTKDVVPNGNATTFPFRLEQCNETSGATCTGSGTFISPDPQVLGDNQTGTWVGLQTPRVYRLTETLPAGWTLSRSCTGGGSSSTNSGANGRIIRLDTGANQQQASCTFTNTAPPDPGSLLIKKAGTRTGAADPNNVQGLPGATFGVYSNANTTTLVATCTPTDANGACQVDGLTPGTYYVKELGPAPGGLQQRQRDRHGRWAERESLRRPDERHEQHDDAGSARRRQQPAALVREPRQQQPVPRSLRCRHHAGARPLRVDVGFSRPRRRTQPRRSRRP